MPASHLGSKASERSPRQLWSRLYCGDLLVGLSKVPARLNLGTVASPWDTTCPMDNFAIISGPPQAALGHRRSCRVPRCLGCGGVGSLSWHIFSGP